jgi:hypothetical protein
MGGGGKVVLSPDEYFNSWSRKPMSLTVIFRDEHGRVLILKPSYRENWILPGGKVADNESPIKAARLAVKESLGFDFDGRRLVLLGVEYVAAMDSRPEMMVFMFEGGTLSENQISCIKLSDKSLDFRCVYLSEAKGLLTDRTIRKINICLNDPESCHYFENGNKVC